MATIKELKDQYYSVEINQPTTNGKDRVYDFVCFPYCLP